MKQSIILWIATIVISFLAGYTQRVISPDYPINGTADLVSGEASFSFDRIFSSNGDYRIIIVNNCRNIEGTLIWKNKQDTSWISVAMKKSGEALTAKIPAHPPLSEVEYRIKLIDENKTFYLPVDRTAEMRFMGAVPSQISMFYYITLFAGLLLAIRTGFEIFKEPPRLRLYTIFTVISFFAFTFIFSTVRKGCELGIIGKTKTASITEIFSSGPVLLFVWWVAAMIIIFNSKNPKVFAVLAAAGTILIFLLGKF